MSEVGRVNVEVGYKFDPGGPDKFRAQMAQMSKEVAAAQRAFGSMAKAARELAGETAKAAKPAEELTDIQKRLKDAGVKTTQAFQTELAALKQLRALFADGSAEAAQLDARIAGVNSQMASTRSVSGQATNTIIQFGRGLEDLSFGFTGVANNIPLVIEGFARLRTNAATTGASVGSALVGALTGPAGLILAFNAATFAAITFGDKLAGVFSDATRDAVASVEDIKKALDDLVDVSALDKFGVDVPDTSALSALSQAAERELAIRKQLVAESRAQLEALTNQQQQSSELYQQLAPQVAAQEKILDARKEALNTAQAAVETLGEERDRLGELERIEQFLVNLGAKRTREIEAQNDALEQQGDIADALRVDLVPKPISFLGTKGRSKEQEAAKKDAALLAKQLDPSNIFKGRGSGFQDTADDAIDAFDRWALSARVLQRQIDAGVLAPIDAARQRVTILRDLFKGLAEQGVDISSDSMAVFREQLVAAQAEIDGGTNATARYIESLNGLTFEQAAVATVAGQVGEAIANTFADAIVNAKKLQDVLGSLKKVLAQVAVKLVTAGITAGIGAATGGSGAAFLPLFGKALGIPTLGTGGIVDKPTLAVIGEAGPEAVIPLDAFSGTTSDPKPLAALAGKVTPPAALAQPVNDYSGPEPLAAVASQAAAPVAVSAPVQDISAHAITDVAPMGASTLPGDAAAGGNFLQRLEIQGLRVSGTDLLLLVREAERRSTRNYGFN